MGAQFTCVHMSLIWQVFIFSSASQWYFFIGVANFTPHYLIKCMFYLILVYGEFEEEV